MTPARCHLGSGAGNARDRMISGTSFDAVEAVLADFLQEDEVLDVISSPIVGPLPRSSPDRIAAVLPPASTNIGEVCELDVAIGQFFGEVAYDLAKQVGESRAARLLHARPSFTGEGDRRGTSSWVSLLGSRGDRGDVVSDVRNRDIAAEAMGHRSRAARRPPARRTSRTVRGALNLGGLPT